MNKRYMDFVPVKPNKVSDTSKIVSVKTTQTEVVSLVASDSLETIKAQNIKAKKIPETFKKTEKPLAKASEMSLGHDLKKNVYQAPKAQFINQEKVTKRPLSRNIYLRELEKDEKPVVEKQEKPVIITSTTEKKSGFKTFLGIVFTIIVGAIAGAVAFLLLPK